MYKKTPMLNNILNLWRKTTVLEILICDDENIFCSHLEKIILEYGQKTGERIMTEVFNSGEKLLEYIENSESAIDIIFLDIEMDGINGVKIGQVLRKEMENNATQIVYVSAKNSYAMELFQNRPFNFLVKPICEEQIYRILDDYYKVSNKSTPFFEITVNRVTKKILVNDIMYFESLTREILIHTTKENISFYGKLSSIENNPSLTNFLRIHKSFLVNKLYIEEYKSTSVQLLNKEVLQISRHYCNLIKQHLLDSHTK
jgi:DNA-binding LytR/AlgR family response regulator